jgi:hypothetical protein
LIGVDFSETRFFCPWVYGPDAAVPVEIKYFNTQDPQAVSDLISASWGNSSPSGRLYILLYTKFRDEEKYRILAKESGYNDREVEVRFGTVVEWRKFPDVVNKISNLCYDWSGTPVNWK